MCKNCRLFHIFSLFFVIIFMLSFSACDTKTHLTHIDGKEVVISTRDQTVTCENDIYNYSYHTGTNTVILTIKYPNGYTFTETATSSSYRSLDDTPLFSHSFTDANGNESAISAEELGFIDGVSLAPKLNSVTESLSAKEGPNLATPSIIIIAGALLVAFPRLFWTMAHGWKYRDAEPSDAALLFYRIGGGVVIFLGIMSMFE